MQSCPILTTVEDMNSAEEVAWVSWETPCRYLNGVNGEKQERWSKMGHEDELQSRDVGASLSSGTSLSKPSHRGAFSTESRNCKIPKRHFYSLFTCIQHVKFNLFSSQPECEFQ